MPLLALLAVLAYLPALSFPFIEDDYPNIAQALEYGPPSGWAGMAGDAINRPRATSFLYLYWLHALAGMNPLPFYAAGIALHAVNTWLVFALGRWRLLGYGVSAWAAAFFAIYEGHQEAVMWISACNELLLFFFGALSLYCWLRFLEPPGGRRWYWAALAAFALALLSKESAVILLVLLAVAAATTTPRKMPLLAPFAVLGAAAVLSILGTQSYSGRFQDGSFVLAAPFWRTWANSFPRLFWIWGLVAVVALLAWKPPHYRRILALGGFWAAAALVPYIFPVYINRVPSRQTYLASAGAAFIVGAALDALWKRRRRAAPLVLALLLVQNIGWLWVRKRAQFLERARPTEQLLELARRSEGPIYVRCFPRQRIIAEQAVRLMAPTRTPALLWEPTGRAAAEFCYDPNR